MRISKQEFYARSAQSRRGMVSNRGRNVRSSRNGFVLSRQDAQAFDSVNQRRGRGVFSKAVGVGAGAARMGGRVVKTARFFSPKKILLGALALLLIGGASAYAAFFTDFGNKLFFSLKGERQGRTNILLMGVGGEDHPGGDLADMVTLVSFNHASKQIGFLSFPRDILVETKYGASKLNAVHAYGEHIDKNGPAAMEAVISEMTDQPVHYYARMDFPGFVELVNSVGGIDVQVDKSYLDPLYPNPEYGKKLSFAEGENHLDGTWALNYARSRFGNNGEGTDIRRAKRHQDILFAFRAKVLQDNVYLNPSKIVGMIGILQKHFTSNLDATEITRLVKLYQEYDHDHIVSNVLDTSPSGALELGSTKALGSVLKTKTGDFSQIQELSREMFAQKK